MSSNFTPEELNDLAEAIGKSVARNVRGMPQPTAASASGVRESMGAGPSLGGAASVAGATIKGSAEIMGDAFSKMATGSLKVNDAFELITRSAGLAGNALGSMAGGLLGADNPLVKMGKFGGEMMMGAFKGMGQSAMIANDNMREFSKSGAYFGNDLGLMSKSVLGARMDMDTFANMIKSSNVQLNHLGSNMDQASLRYLTMAKQMQERPLADELRRTGMGLDEFNEFLSENLSRRRYIDFSDERARKQAIDSTLQLAVEMDNTARLTGMTRQEQLKAKQDIEERPDVKLFRATLDQAQQDVFDRMEEMTSTMGSSVQRAFAEAATGGIRTQEGAAAVAAMGEAGPLLMKAAQSIQSTDAAERERGVEEMKAAKEMYMAMHQNKEWLQQASRVSLSNDAVAQQMAKQYTEDREAAVNLQQKREAAKLGMTLEEYQAAEEKKLAAQRQGKTPEGEVAPEAAPARAINEMIGMNKDLQAGFGEVINDFNRNLYDSSELFRELNANLKPITTEQSKAALEAMKEFASNVSGAIPSVVGAPGSMQAPKPSGPEKEPEGGGTWIKSREKGTPGESGGKLIEDWGVESLVKLHKKEGVIPENVLDTMYKNAQTAISTVAKSGSDKISSITGKDLVASATTSPIAETVKLLGNQMSVHIDKLGNVVATQIKDLGKQLADSMATVKSSTATTSATNQAAKPTTTEKPTNQPVVDELKKQNKTAEDHKKATETSAQTATTTNQPVVDELKKQNKTAEDHKKIAETSAKTAETKLIPVTDQADIAEFGAELTAVTPDIRTFSADLKEESNRAKQAAKEKSSEKKDESKGFFDQMGDLVYGIGNFASKQYDDITTSISSTLKETTSFIDDSFEKSAESVSVAGNDFGKTLSDLGVTPMIGTSQYEKVEEKNLDMNDAFTKVAYNTSKEFEKMLGRSSEYYKTSKPAEGINLKDYGVTPINVSSLGAGSDMAAINKSRSAATDEGARTRDLERIRREATIDLTSLKTAHTESATIKDTTLKESMNKIAQTQSSVVSKLSRERATEPKTVDFEKMFSQIKIPKFEEESANVKGPTPVATPEDVPMIEIKNELVQLNMNIRELISHTSDVASTAKHQVRATKRVSTNNMLG